MTWHYDEGSPRNFCCEMCTNFGHQEEEETGEKGGVEYIGRRDRREREGSGRRRKEREGGREEGGVGKRDRVGGGERGGIGRRGG